MLRRILGMILSLFMLLSLMTTVALAAAQDTGKSDTDVAYPVEGGNVYFNPATGAITDCDEYVTRAALPNEIGGIRVTSIGASAFYRCRFLTEISVPEGVIKIGNFAFLDCADLTRVDLPSTLTTIGYGAFQNCTALTEIVLPDGVTSLGNRAFYQCEALSRVVLPSGLTRIGDWTFYACRSLPTVELPAALREIGDSAWNSCTSLAALTLPDGVTKIGEWAFHACGLTKLNIPASVRSIGEAAFRGCRSLNGIWVDAENEIYASDSFGVLFNKAGTVLVQASGALKGAYTVPDGVTTIDANAFRECGVLTQITIPNGVKDIREAAFRECDALTSVVLPDTVSVLSAHVFQYCESLETIIVPESIVSIEEDAFFGCEKLKAVCFLGDAPSLKGGAFLLCDRNMRFYCLDGKAGWTLPEWNGHATALWDGVHSYQAEEISPTCTEQGYTIYICAICGASYQDDFCAPIGHECVSVPEVPPTCESDGLTAGAVCILCDMVLSEQAPIPALGHDFGAWTQTKSATCTENGEQIRCCAQCSTTETKPVEALGHAYKDGACTRCGIEDPDCRIPAVDFTDVAKNAWYKESVDYAVSKGLMNGMGNNTFEPDTATNRAMLVTILWRYAGSPVDGTNDFADVPNGQWFTQAVAWAAKNGIVTGVGNNKFDPEGKLTREQLATILFRYSKLQELDTSARAEFSKFEDGGKVQSWSKEAVQWAVAEGIIGGTSENGKLYLDPQGNATRAQVATILMRFIENVLKK